MAAPRADLMVLIRHARPEVDPTKPSREWTLGIDGMEGSLRLAERLRPAGLELVVSSVEAKAVETGRLIAQVLDLDWQTGHDLHEHQRRTAGYLDGATFDASIRRLFREPATVVFGEESADIAAARFDAAVDAVRKVNRGRRLGIVAHGTVLSLHLERRYGADGYSTWKRLGTPSFVIVDRRSRAIVDVVGAI